MGISLTIFEIREFATGAERMGCVIGGGGGKCREGTCALPRKFFFNFLLKMIHFDV